VLGLVGGALGGDTARRRFIGGVRNLLRLRLVTSLAGPPYPSRSPRAHPSGGRTVLVSYKGARLNSIIAIEHLTILESRTTTLRRRRASQLREQYSS